MMHHSRTRREIMVSGALAVAAAGMGVGVLGATSARAATEVVAAVFPGAWEDQFADVVAPVLKGEDVDLVVVGALASDQLGRMMASPGNPPYDALLMSPGQTAVARAEGLIAEVDSSMIGNWNNIAPAFRNPWGPAITIQLDGLAYNPEKVRKPEGYADLFSPDFAGRVAFTGFKSNSAVMAWVQMAKALGGSEDDLGPLWTKLETYLPNVGAIANDMNHQQTLFQQGEIDVMIASTNNVARLKSLGVPIEFVIPAEGAPATPVSIHVANNISDERRSAVHAYMDAVISAEVQAALQEAPLGNFPVNDDVPVSAEVARYMRREDLESFVYLDWGKINEHREEWTIRFDEIVRA